MLQDICRARGLRLVQLTPRVMRLEQHPADRSFGAISKDNALLQELDWIERATKERP